MPVDAHDLATLTPAAAARLLAARALLLKSAAGPLDEAGNWLSGKANQVVDWAKPHIQPMLDSAVGKQISEGLGQAGDYIKNNPWAWGGLAGAGLGGVIGLGSGLLRRRRKGRALGDALTGAVLGGGLGAGAGQLYGQLSGGTSAPQEKLFPEETSSQAPAAQQRASQMAGDVEKTRAELLQNNERVKALQEANRQGQNPVTFGLGHLDDPALAGRANFNPHSISGAGAGLATAAAGDIALSQATKAQRYSGILNKAQANKDLAATRLTNMAGKKINPEHVADYLERGIPGTAAVAGKPAVKGSPFIPGSPGRPAVSSSPFFDPATGQLTGTGRLPVAGVPPRPSVPAVPAQEAVQAVKGVPGMTVGEVEKDLDMARKAVDPGLGRYFRYGRGVGQATPSGNAAGLLTNRATVYPALAGAGAYLGNMLAPGGLQGALQHYQSQADPHHQAVVEAIKRIHDDPEAWKALTDEQRSLYQQALSR
jgi:ElaB/YqjD/DUF883 family membrane-anchored ribosome-binding protein